MKKLVLIGLVIMVVLINIVVARTNTGPPDSSVDFLIDGWDRLPFKDQRYNSSWVRL